MQGPLRLLRGVHQNVTGGALTVHFAADDAVVGVLLFREEAMVLCHFEAGRGVVGDIKN